MSVIYEGLSKTIVKLDYDATETLSPSLFCSASGILFDHQVKKLRIII